jgi:hypothetical protein
MLERRPIEEDAEPRDMLLSSNLPALGDRVDVACASMETFGLEGLVTLRTLVVGLLVSLGGRSVIDGSATTHEINCTYSNIFATVAY